MDADLDIKAYLVAKIKSNIDKNYEITWCIIMLPLCDTRQYLFKPGAHAGSNVLFLLNSRFNNVKGIFQWTI